MLGASLAALILVSAFVAFGSWPGESSGKQVDQVLLRDVATTKAAKPVAVRTDAVKTAKRAETRRQIAQARRQGKKIVRMRDGNVVVKTPSKSTNPTTAAGTPVAALPGGVANPTTGVKQQTENATQNVTKNLDTTTNQVTDNVNNTVDQTTTQVNQVVDQVVSGVQQTTDTATQQVQNTVTTTTGTVQNVTDGLLGP
jgi:hypothetical protein